MKAVHTFSMAILLSFIGQACTWPSNTNQSLDINKTNTPKEVALIYDYDPAKTRLEFRAVKMPHSSGDPLEDAIRAFLSENRLSGQFDEMGLDRQVTEDQTTTFIFSGKPHYGSPQDSSLFLQALDMTIARHHNTMDYQIVLLDQ
ncbi:MAG: hypothetical protein AAFV95_26700 [Bacteroidota bacterium]